MTESEPVLVLGALGFGGFVDSRKVSLIMDEAYSLGVNTVDLAKGYGSGLARGLVAGHLRSRPRQTWKVWDKLGLRWVARGLDGVGGVESYWGDEEILNKEIRELEIQYPNNSLSMIQLHSSLGQNEPHALRHLVEFSRRHPNVSFGISNHSPSETIQISQALGLVGIKLVSAQVQLSILEQMATKSLVGLCSSLGIEVCANRVFARGLLVKGGLETTVRLLSSERIKSKRAARAQDIKVFMDLATGIGVSPMQLALRWLFEAAHVDKAIIGISQPGQITEVFEAISKPELRIEWGRIYDKNKDFFLSTQKHPSRYLDES